MRMLTWRLVGYIVLAAAWIGAGAASAQCPWARSVPALNGACACSYNLAQELTLQCGAVDLSVLTAALKEHGQGQVIDLLYVHNSTVNELRDNTFQHISVNNIQLSRCEIRRIGPAAFRGQEETLRNLNLQDNLLTSVPSEALRSMRKLALVDLSGNRISHVPDDAFASLRLTTLKLADNNLTVAENAFRGLESSLKNLNLKGTRQRTIPLAVRRLQQLSFLDLAHNNIRNVTPGVLARLDSLTAVNLERNFIQSLDAAAFAGVNDTLSSLSLLNNLITEFPTRALAALTELRVLDVGFNLISRLPEDSFASVRALTLLALDGNPLATLPRANFAHLNGTLRGLSLGGRALRCDCKLRWIAEWIRDQDLQVTSRERNPQFCGAPDEFRSRSFYQLGPEDLKCASEEDKSDEEDEDVFRPINPSTSTRPPPLPTPPAPSAPTKALRREEDSESESREYEEETEEDGETEENTDEDGSQDLEKKVITAPEQETFLLPPVSVAIVPIGPSRRRPTPPTLLPTPPPTLPTTPSRPPAPPSRLPTPAQPNPARPTFPSRNGPTRQNTREKIPNRPGAGLIASSAGGQRPQPSRVRPNYGQQKGRPNLVVGPNINTNGNGYLGPHQRPETHLSANSHSLNEAAATVAEKDVIVKDAYRQDTSVVIQWDSDTTNILGFRVVYRLFGDNTFQPGPPLDPSEREFKIKNVPAQESLVVCVVSLEDSHVTPETVPFNQCREIRTEGQTSTHMDKIIIAASAAICGTVVIAVVVFICCNRKRSRKSEKMHLNKVLAPAAAVNAVSAASLAGSQVQSPMANMAAMGMGLPPGVKDWDQMSMYSSRSIPRARMFAGEQRPGSVMGSVNGGFIPDDARSHVSSYSMHANSKGQPVNLVRSRSLADGQSQRSMSQMSGRYLPSHGLHGMPMSMPIGTHGMSMAGLQVPNMGLGMSRSGSMRNGWQEALSENDSYLRDQGLVRL